MKESPQIKLYEYTDSQFTLQAIIDDYKEVSFEHSLYNAGTFTITINYNIPNAHLFKRGLFVQFGDSPFDFGEIVSLSNSIGSDGKGSELLNITGYDARYLFKRRIIKNLNSNDVWAMTAKAEICMRSLVYSECGEGAEEKRRLPVTNIIPNETEALGTKYSVSEAYTNLYDVLCTIATQSELGWAVKFENDELSLYFYNGREVQDSVFFSTDFESLANGEFIDSAESYANTVYIGGKGEGSEQDIYEGSANEGVVFLLCDKGFLITEDNEKLVINEGTEPVNLNRYEAYDSQTAMTSEEEYKVEANSMLSQYGQNLTVRGAGLVKCPFVFREEYDIGDVVTIRFSDKEAVTQILSVTEQWSWGSYSLSFEFGKPQNSLAQQIGLMLKKIAGATNKTNSVSSVKWYAPPAETQQAEADVTFGTLGFTGSGGTFTLYLDSGSTGAKHYMIYIKNLSGNLTLKTSVSGMNTVTLTSGSYVTSIYVDDEGNIYRQQ